MVQPSKFRWLDFEWDVLTGHLNLKESQTLEEIIAGIFH